MKVKIMDNLEVTWISYNGSYYGVPLRRGWLRKAFTQIASIS